MLRRCGSWALEHRSVVVARGPSCSAACGSLPDQGSNPRLLRWQQVLNLGATREALGGLDFAASFLPPLRFSGDRDLEEVSKAASGSAVQNRSSL